MIEHLSAAPGVAAIRATGWLDERDINEAIAIIEEVLARQPQVAIFIEVDIAGMSTGAIARDISYGLGKLGEIHRFPRVALVTGEDWIRRLAQLQDRLLPQIEMRVFYPAERDAAMEWAASPLPPPRTGDETPQEPAIRVIETERTDLVAFEIDGRIRKQDMQLVVTLFEAAMKSSPKLRVLVRVVHFGGMTIDALGVEGLPAMKMKGFRQVERYAVVGGPDWMKTTAERLGPYAPVDTRHFPEEAEAEAWAWVEADAA